MSEKASSIESVVIEKSDTESVGNSAVVEMSEKVSSAKSTGNSNVVLYSPPSSEKVIKVHPDNIRFIIHRRGFITCVCGNTLRKHTCVLENAFKEVRLKFDMCPKKETCRFCEDIVEWNYQRFKSTDTVCNVDNAIKKLSSLKESVTTVFVLFALDFWTIVFVVNSVLLITSVCVMT